MAETAVVGYGHEDYGEGIFCDHYGDPYIKVIIIIIIRVILTSLMRLWVDNTQII